MSVYKMVDVVGTSGTSVSDAVRGAVHRAGETLEDLQWFEVKEIRGRIDGKEIAEYQVRVEIGFRLHAASGNGQGTRAGTKQAGTREARSQAAQAAARKGGARGSAKGVAVGSKKGTRSRAT